MLSASPPADPQPHFGRRGGGGRRSSGRIGTQLSAIMRTLLKSRSVELSDISATGAQLRSPDAPRAGEELFLRIGVIEVFGRVAWSHGELFGVAFDEPLSAAEVTRLRDEGRRTSLMRMTPQQREAWENWVASSR